MHHLGLPNGESFDLDYIKERISHQDDERLFFIGEAIRRGTTLEEIHNMTHRLITSYTSSKTLLILSITKRTSR